MTTPDYILQFREKFPTWAEPEPGAGEGLGPLAGVGMYMQYDIDRKRRDEEINHVESFIIKLVEDTKERYTSRGGMAEALEEAFESGKQKGIQEAQQDYFEAGKVAGANRAVDYISERLGKNVGHATWEIVGSGWKEIMESARTIKP